MLLLSQTRIDLKHLARLLPVFLCFSSIAQVNVIIKDPTNSGFILGVNGFVQNTEPVDQVIIKGLDTIPHQLIVQLDSTVWFSKLIHLRSSGNYNYIITTNSRDELQLRYRGKTSSPPSGIVSMEVQRLVPMQQPEPVITASVKSSDNFQITSADTVETKVVVPTREIVEVKTVAPEFVHLIPDSTKLADPTEKTDTLPLSSDTILSMPSPFAVLLTNLQKTEFEFEKLQKSEDFIQKHSFTIEELRQVFRLLSYDNSRLQLLQSIHNDEIDMSVYQDLAEELDYEISRQKFNEILKE